jgi:DNA repair protein RecO (recombination protein O)
MSLAAFKLLRYLQSQPLEISGELRISSATRAETESLLSAYLRHILEYDPRSLAFLDDVRQMPRTSGPASVGSSAT